jgi:hypothetical protein
MKVDLNILLTLIGAHTEFAKDIKQVIEGNDDIAKMSEGVLTNLMNTMEKLTGALLVQNYELVEKDSVLSTMEDFDVDLPTELDEQERCAWDEEESAN